MFAADGDESKGDSSSVFFGGGKTVVGQGIVDPADEARRIQDVSKMLVGCEVDGAEVCVRGSVELRFRMDCHMKDEGVIRVKNVDGLVPKWMLFD